MGSRAKQMEEMMANMPDPEAIFRSWWPFIIAGVIGTLYGLRQWVRGPKCIGGAKLNGKTIIVTGGSGGIGIEIAIFLAKRGGRVILGCRDEIAGKKAAEEIRKDTENMDVYCLKLDLNSFKSVREFVEKFKKKEKSLHILINNAGVMMCPREKTEDGFDSQFQSNYLGAFLLTELLLDLLKESAPSRIIYTTASAQNLGDIDFNDINSENKEYNNGDMYAQSKLAVVLHAFQLAERLKDTKVTSNVVNPGLCNTEIYRHLPLKTSKFIRISFGPFTWFFMKFAEDGAQMAVYCSTAEEMEEVTGKYIKDAKQVDLDGKAQDKMLQEQLYRASLKWIEGVQAISVDKDGDKDASTDATVDKTPTKTAANMERVEI